MCWCKVSIVVLLCASMLSDVATQSFRSEEGPFKTVITNTSSCVTGPAWFHSSITSYSRNGQSLLRGSLNSTQLVKDIKFRLLMYYLEATKVKVFDMKNQNCHNNIIELILNTIHVPFHKQTCKIKAGFYEFSELNVDAIIHTVVQSLWYGSAQLRLEVDTRSARLLCIDIYYRTVKIDKAR